MSPCLYYKTDGAGTSTLCSSKQKLSRILVNKIPSTLQNRYYMHSITMQIKTGGTPYSYRAIGNPFQLQKQVVQGLRLRRSPCTTCFCSFFSQKRAVDAVNGSLSIISEKIWDISCSSFYAVMPAIIPGKGPLNSESIELVIGASHIEHTIRD